MNTAGPTSISFPAHRETHCGRCEHHKCIGSFHVRCGEGGWREYVCGHPQAYEPLSKDVTPEQALAIGRLRALTERDGRYIGKTEKTPNWCPFLRPKET